MSLINAIQSNLWYIRYQRHSSNTWKRTHLKACYLPGYILLYRICQFHLSLYLLFRNKYHICIKVALPTQKRRKLLNRKKRPLKTFLRRQLKTQYLLLDHKKVYKYENTYHKIESLLISLNEMIMDYDIILIMTNKDSQKFIKPILKYIEK